MTAREAWKAYTTWFDHPSGATWTGGYRVTVSVELTKTIPLPSLSLQTFPYLAAQIVEECEDRLTGDQMQEIIDLVAASLLPDPTQNGEGDESFYGENGYDHAEEGAGAEEDEEEYMMNWQEGGQGGEDFYAENKWGKEADEGDGAIDE